MTVQFSQALTTAIKNAFQRAGISEQDVMEKLQITELEAIKLLSLERWDIRQALNLAWAFDLQFEIYAHTNDGPTPQQVLDSLEGLQWALADQERPQQDGKG